MFPELATFCLRLACGLAGCLVLLPTLEVHPRFYRTHFLTILGLLVVAILVHPPGVGMAWWMAVGVGFASAFLGSLVWYLEGLPGRKTLIGVNVLALVAALALGGPVTAHAADWTWLLIGDLTSAALLGTATTAMLMGHSYLIAPTMSLTPLLRLLTALFVVIGLRMAVAGIDLASWTAGHPLTNLEGAALLWLPVRWGVGFVGPLILGWMAREATKIRSTQSATGILYVVVVFCFLGELTSQLLLGAPRITL